DLCAPLSSPTRRSSDLQQPEIPRRPLGSRPLRRRADRGPGVADDAVSEGALRAQAPPTATGAAALPAGLRSGSGRGCRGPQSLRSEEHTSELQSLTNLV